jgi:signal peptidase I
MNASIDNTQTQDEQTSRSTFLREIGKTVFLILIIVVPVRMFIISPFVVSGESMSPTFESGDYLIVDKLSYRFVTPQRGDVIVFRYPGNPSVFFIKRIIGLPKETVAIKDGTVTISQSTNIPNTQTLSEPYIMYPKNDTMTVTLGNQDYFVMGDNRYASSDSRVWGTLNRGYIDGKIAVRLLPVAHIGWFPGETSY